MTPPLRVSRQGVEIAGPLEELAAEFRARELVRLPGFLEPLLLSFVQERIASEPFYELEHGGIGLESCLQKNGTLLALLFVVNDPRLFRVVQEITGCPTIGCFSGRVYRVAPGRGHHDDWHDDNVGGRLVGLTLNLSGHAFEGSELQVRRKKDGLVAGRVRNTGPGDAVLFRIGEDLEHRMTDLEGKRTKTAFAGWFCSHPSFSEILKDFRSSEPEATTPPSP